MSQEESPTTLQDMFSPREWTADELSPDHFKLLYLISRYSGEGKGGGGQRWVRGVPLLVLLYEGILTKVFDYDYAPASVKVGRRRIYMNVSQEGKDDIDDLREAGLIQSLKLTNNLKYIRIPAVDS